MDPSHSDLKKVSKYLSYLLRHRPDSVGLKLDAQGWASLAELIQKADSSLNLTIELIDKVVKNNDKQRFKLSPDGLRIRASQGHSVEVDLALKPKEPPTLLYHGTATRFLEAINQQGLKPGKRTHVHLSANTITATAVGKRHGTPVVLTIQAGAMFQQGFHFYLSDNNVWLTHHVPPHFIEKV